MNTQEPQIVVDKPMWVRRREAKAEGVAKEARVKLLKELMDEAEASLEYHISYADLTCRWWIEQGWCPYCGSPKHGPDDCETMRIYMEAQERDGEL